MQGKIVRLDPLVRRVLSSQARATLPTGRVERAEPEYNCGKCYGTGIVPVPTRNASVVFRTCRVCRSDDLYVLVCESGEGDWIAVRDIPHAAARGGCPVEALLSLERRIDPNQSVFSAQYLVREAADRGAQPVANSGAQSAPGPG